MFCQSYRVPLSEGTTRIIFDWENYILFPKFDLGTPLVVSFSGTFTDQYEEIES